MDFYEQLKSMGINTENIKYTIENNIIYLSGSLPDQKEVVKVGHLAAKLDGIKNVVCDINRKTSTRDLSPYIAKGIIAETDIAIIGAGIIGCGIARELSFYQSCVLVIEKEEDISCGTTKANNGMIHSGYDSSYGTLKARLNVEGNALYSKWAEDLGFRLNRTGSLICGFDDEDARVIKQFYANGVKNQVPGIEIIDGNRTREIAPNLSKDINISLWTPSAAYVEPYEVTLALAENAIDNGTQFLFNCEVVGFQWEGNKIIAIVTTEGIIRCKFVINAAGVFAEDIAEMAKDRFYSLHPRRGTIILFDKECCDTLDVFVGLAPKNYTKGGGVMLTPAGTMLWGPSASEIEDKEDVSVNIEDLNGVLDKGFKLLKTSNKGSIITYFAGNRAASYTEDFIIENSCKNNNFTHVAGIQSPGIAAAPAITNMVVQLVHFIFPLIKKSQYITKRTVKCSFNESVLEEKKILIESNSSYAYIVCRCEIVTEAEILEAIGGKIPAKSLDAIKRRTRAGMGRCQGGFCGSKILEILSKELNCDLTEITLKGKDSYILAKKNRNGDYHD